MSKLARVKAMENYIHEFFSTRIDEYRAFYNSEYQNRDMGFYKMEKGSLLLDFLQQMIFHIDDNLYQENLVPQYHSSPEDFILWLKGFKGFLNQNQDLLDKYSRGENINYKISDMQEMKSDLVNLVDVILSIYDDVEPLIPYQKLRHALITKDIPTFLGYLKSILAQVSYAISKDSEGFVHSNIQVALSILGFNIVSEDSTNIGRIDAVIRFADYIYIFEFKKGENSSKKALEQIFEKKYYEKFLIEEKEILLIGVGFDKKNIGDYEVIPYPPKTTP